VRITGPTLSDKKVTVQILDEINLQIERFLLVQVFTSAIVAVVSWAVFAWLGLEQPVIWAIAAGLFNSIPYFGPVVVTGGIFVVALLQFGNPGMASVLAGSSLLITSLEGFLLTPWLTSRAASMNPVAIFIGLLFWSWVWGVWGTILAVPMMMMAKAICDRVEDLQPVGELLGE
jgi:predicted PurR-regulated permease PerM